MTLTTVLTLATICAILVFLTWIIIHYSSLIYSSLHGAPYIPTRAGEIRQILTAAQLGPQTRFIDIGCGDGRLVHLAATEFGADAHGIDINPLLIAQARRNTPSDASATFTVADIMDTRFADYDVIYLYLLPQYIKKLAPRMRQHARPGSLIISHWFRLRDWEDLLENQITAGKYPTFYYRIPYQDDLKLD